jgi:hypothetical protein
MFGKGFRGQFPFAPSLNVISAGRRPATAVGQQRALAVRTAAR